MERRVRFSIRVKIIAVISALVVLSLGLYLIVALNLFNKDKKAYVYQSGSATAATVSVQVETFLNRILKDSLSVYNLIVDRNFEPERERLPEPFETYVQVKSPAQAAAAVARLAELAPKAEKAALAGAGMKMRIEAAQLYVQRGEWLRAQDLAAMASGTQAGKSGRSAAPWREAFGEVVRLLEPKSGDDGEAAPELKDVDGVFALARAYERLGRYEDAEDQFAKLDGVAKADRRQWEVAFSLAEVRFRMRQFARAAAGYRKVLQTKDKDHYIYGLYKLAWCEIGLGHPREALADLARVTKAEREAPPALRHAAAEDAARVLENLGDSTAAEAFYRDVAGGAALLAEVKAATVQLHRVDKGRPGATTLLEGQRLLRSLFYFDPDMVEFSVYQRSGSRYERLARLVNVDYLKDSGLTAAYLSRVDAEKPLPFAQVTTQKPLLVNSSLKGGMGLLTLIRQDPLTSRFIVVRIKMDRFLAFFTQDMVYSTYLVNSSGDLLAHQDQQMLVREANMLDEPHVREVLKIGQQSGQKSGLKELVNRAGEDVIVAYADAGLFDLWVLSEIKTKKAFLAARELTVKSVYFGIFFIAVAMIIGIVFARSLTNPIDKLFKGTKVIAAGNFKAKVLIKANDEIGILADSFNFMAGRIVELLEQEKDKVRLEEEMKVAKLVQDSFFPPTHMIVGGMDVAAFYTPASDCGGDWWGYVKHGSKVMLLIGDATGHGVPAALITATAASCTTTVQELGAVHPDLLDSPARVLSLLNKAVYGAAQGKILMTFFVCLIDPVDMTITYSNASHNPPYLYKYQTKDPDKKDLKPLMDAVELRLGHKPDTVYADAKTTIAPNDVIVFFTDGFIECMNPNKEEYGSRKFIKSILKYVKGGTEEMREGVVGTAKEFFSTQPLADDLTLVVAKVLPAQVGKVEVA